MFIYSVQIALGERTLQVQLFEYSNPLNLEIRPDNPDSTYCCCNQADLCFPSIENFNTSHCRVQCDLVFSVCVQNPSSSEETCLLSSEKGQGFPFFPFAEKSAWFSEQSTGVLLNFGLNSSFSDVSD